MPLLALLLFLSVGYVIAIVFVAYCLNLSLITLLRMTACVLLLIGEPEIAFAYDRTHRTLRMPCLLRQRKITLHTILL